MIRKIEFQWQVLDEFTKRAKVYGGWILHHGSHSNKGSVSESMVFFHDPEHQWVITNLPKLELKDG